MKVTPCRMVLYRNRDGADMPALVTGLDSAGDPFLTCFPAPGAALDHMDYQWGVPQESDADGDLIDADGHSRRRWRWPPRETA